MNYIEAIILGVVEGLTEFIPVSSTAHLIVTSRLLNLDLGSDFIKTFQIFIQFGAILAVLFLYTKKLLVNKDLILKIIVGFIPTAIIGFFLYPIVKDFLLESITTLSIALVLGGIFMILIERYMKIGGTDSVSWAQAIYLGLFQALAIIPGVSRSGATIMGGLLLGVNRSAIVEFSFLLAIPTMAGASGLDLIYSFNNISGNWLILLTGFVASFITAILVIKWLVEYVKRYSFTSFGWYRIVIGLLFLIWLV